MPVFHLFVCYTLALTNIVQRCEVHDSHDTDLHIVVARNSRYVLDIILDRKQIETSTCRLHKRFTIQSHQHVPMQLEGYT